MPQTTVEDVRVPQDVVDFCAEHGLAADLQLSLGLVREIFGPVRELVVEVEIDPETGERYVVVNVCRTLSVEDALAHRRAYTTKWIQSASPEGRLTIRMLSDIS
jgi:hypothetical protein